MVEKQVLSPTILRNRVVDHVHASAGNRAGMNMHPQHRQSINNPRHEGSSHEEILNGASPHRYEDQDHSSILQELTIANLRSDLELAEERASKMTNEVNEMNTKVDELSFKFQPTELQHEVTAERETSRSLNQEVRSLRDALASFLH